MKLIRGEPRGATLSGCMAVAVAFLGDPATATQIEQLEASPDVEIAQGYFREYAIDHPRSGPAIVLVDRNNDVWVALARSGKLARFSNDGLETYDIGDDSRPVAIAVSPSADGKEVIWISAAFDEKIVRFDEASKSIKKYTLGTETMWPFMIGLTRNGQIWFTERAAGRIGRLDPDTGAVEHIALPSSNAGPAGIAIDPQKDTIWFTEGQVDRVGMLDPANGKVQEYVMGEESTGMVSGPAGITIDHHGEVWFTKLEGKLGHIDAARDVIELVDMPIAARRPAGIAVGPGDDIWCLALDGNLILRYLPSERKFTLYPIPTGGPDPEPDTPPTARTSRPFGLAFDHQGNLWFSEQYTGQLGVLALAASEVRLIAPAGIIGEPDPLVTLRALDRVSGISKVDYLLDGNLVGLSAGRLSLFNEKPGAHHLAVRVSNRAGIVSNADAWFDYEPSLAAIERLLAALHPIDAPGVAARKAVLEELRRLGKDQGRNEALARALTDLRGHRQEFENFPDEQLRVLAAYFMEGASAAFEVQILDSAPYFSPSEIRIRSGDIVTWRYNPAITGHVLAQHLQRVDIVDESISSPLLRAGESFLHQFVKPGQYHVFNGERPAAQAIIEVTARD